MNQDTEATDYLIHTLVFKGISRLGDSSFNKASNCISKLFECGFLNSQNVLAFIQKDHNGSSFCDMRIFGECNFFNYIPILGHIIDDMDDALLTEHFRLNFFAFFLFRAIEDNPEYMQFFSTLIDKAACRLGSSNIHKSLLYVSSDASVFSRVFEDAPYHALQMLLIALNKGHIIHLSEMEDMIIGFIESIEMNLEIGRLLVKAASDKQCGIRSAIRNIVLANPDCVFYVGMEYSGIKETHLILISDLMRTYPPYSNTLDDKQSLCIIDYCTFFAKNWEKSNKYTQYISDNFRPYYNVVIHRIRDKYNIAKCSFENMTDKYIEDVLTALAEEEDLDSFKNFP